MRTFLLLFLLTLCPLRADDDDKAKKLAEQETAVESAWKALELGDMARFSTDHLRLVAPKALEPKLKTMAATIERYRVQAMSTLKLDDKELPNGKMTVYLLPSVANYRSFARLVEKRRPESGQANSFSAQDDRSHVAVTPGKEGSSLEVQAGELLGSLLLMRKARPSTPVPDWLAVGFGRAITYKLYPKDKAVLADKKLIKTLARKRPVADVWNARLEGDEVAPMNAALAEFFAFGPGAARFPKLLLAFRPGEGTEIPTFNQALDTIGVAEATIEKTFKSWVAK